MEVPCRRVTTHPGVELAAAGASRTRSGTRSTRDAGLDETATEFVTGPDGAFRHEFTPPGPDSEVGFAFMKLDGPGQETKTQSRVIGPGDSLSMNVVLDFDAAAEGASDEEAEPSGGAGTAPASEREDDPDASYGDTTLLAYVPFDGGTPGETESGAREAPP